MIGIANSNTIIAVNSDPNAPIFKYCDYYTVGNVADIVWNMLSKKFNRKIELEIKNIQDFRNYKVSTQKAQDILGARFHGSVEAIVEELAEDYPPDFDFGQDNFYNIRVFKNIFKG